MEWKGNFIGESALRKKILVIIIIIMMYVLMMITMLLQAVFLSLHKHCFPNSLGGVPCKFQIG